MTQGFSEMFIRVAQSHDATRRDDITSDITRPINTPWHGTHSGSCTGDIRPPTTGGQLTYWIRSGTLKTLLALDGSNWQRVDLFDFQVDIEGIVVENLARR